MIVVNALILSLGFALSADDGSKGKHAAVVQALGHVQVNISEPLLLVLIIFLLLLLL